MGITENGKCNVCRMEYCPELHSNVLAHRRHHRLIVGSKQLPLKSDQVLEEDAKRRIVLVSPGSGIYPRKRLEKFSRRLNLELGFDVCAYEADGDHFAHNTHGFMAFLDHRPVGFLLLEWSLFVYRLTWAEWSRGVTPEPTTMTAPCWTVTFIGVQSNQRRNGLGSWLLSVASRWAKVPIQDLAWGPPFTRPLGERFVRRHTGDSFFVGVNQPSHRSSEADLGEESWLSELRDLL